MFLIGNLGGNGEEGIIKDLQNEDNYLVLIKSEQYSRNWQNPEKVRRYIMKNMNKTGKIVLITIIATGVLLIVLAVLLIVKIAASNSQYDIEENAFANDGFVLEEFTEAEKQSETVSKD